MLVSDFGVTACLAVFGLLFFFIEVSASDTEAQLVNELFYSYNPLIRPAQDANSVVRICFGLQLIQLITVDERNQVMKSNVWMRMRWTDFQLKWKPANYDNITVIRIASDRVWQPDIVLFNNADGKYEVSYKSRALLYSKDDTSPEVFFLPPSIYKSSCRIDVKYFPFDQQECEMKFGSWTFNAEQVDLEFDGGFPYVDLSDYVVSGTWDVIDCPGYHRKIIGVNGEPNRTRIDFKIVLRRKTLFYTVNLIIPCVLISFLSICVFYLPADAGEKMTLSISILLALVVFLLLLQKILPPTSTTIPLIASYLLFTFILNIISIVVTVVIINWSHRTPRTHTMPRWVRVVFIEVLPRFLLMSHPNSGGGDDVDCSNKQPEEDIYAPINNNNNGHNSYNSQQQQGFTCWTSKLGREFGLNQNSAATAHYERQIYRQQQQQHYMKASDYQSEVPRVQLTREVYKTVQAIRFIAHHLKKEDDYDQVSKDWKFVGLVVDRLLLIIFFAVTTSGTLGIFVNSPHIFEFVDQQKTIERLKRIKNEASLVRTNSCFE